MKDTEGNASTDNHGKLKPIDIKDIDTPEVTGLSEKRGKETIENREVHEPLDDANCKCIKEQWETYAQHLKQCLENLLRW